MAAAHVVSGLRAFLWLAAWALAFALGGCAGESAPSPDAEEVSGPWPPFGRLGVPARPADVDPPRAVVLVVIDTLRADHLGCYGADGDPTPVLDAFAARSLLFRNAIAPSSWTRSSVASLLTSRYPSTLGCLEREDRLREREYTLPEILRSRAGFHTLGVSANGNAGRAFGFAQGFDVFHDDPPWDARAKYPEDPESARKITGDLVTAAVAHLLEAREARAREKPLFLFAHSVDPHDPYFPHDDLQDGPVPPGRFSGSRTDLDRMRLVRERHTEADRARIRHLYRGEVRYADRCLGELFLALHEAFGTLDDLLIVVTADHGEGLWDHGERAHGCDLFEEQVHVPLLVHLPGMGEGSGRVIDDPVSLVDVAPTLLAACGLPIPVEFQGFDLGPLVRREPRSTDHDFVYTEMKIDGRDFEALRSKRHKIVRDRSLPLGAPESYAFFDLEADPLERRDLARREDPEVQASLADHRRFLWRWSSLVAATGALEGERDTIELHELDDETLRQMYGLGYVGGREVEAILRERDQKAARDR